MHYKGRAYVGLNRRVVRQLLLQLPATVIHHPGLYEDLKQQHLSKMGAFSFFSYLFAGEQNRCEAEQVRAQ